MRCEETVPRAENGDVGHGSRPHLGLDRAIQRQREGRLPEHQDVGSFAELPVFFLREPQPRFTRYVEHALAAGAAKIVDEDGLADSIACGPRSLDLFATVTAVRPFERVVVERERVVRTRSLPTPVSDRWLDAPVEELVPLVRERLLQTLERAVRGARRVCVMLGGIDSSATLGALRQLLPADRLMAITQTFDSADADPDVPYASRLCESLDVRHTLVSYEAGGPPEASLLLDEMPSHVYAGVERAAMETAVDAGADVALSAGFGDVVFGGDLRELGLRPPGLATARALRMIVPWRTRARARARWLLDSRFPRIAAWRSPPPPWARGGLLTRWAAALPPVARTPAERIASWCNEPNLVSMAGYGRTIARGLPIRYADAFADEHLLAVLASVPIETLNCDGRFRGLLHRVVRPWLTDAVAKRTTKSTLGNGSIPRTAALRDMASGRELERRGLVNGRALAQSFERSTDITPLWSALAAEAWLRRHAS